MAQQRAAVERLAGAEVQELDTGHLPMLGQPERLAAILNAAAM
jgi:hypothetical protein